MSVRSLCGILPTGANKPTLWAGGPTPIRFLSYYVAELQLAKNAR